MNEEIKKFWKDIGYRIIGPTLIDSWEGWLGDGSVRRIETLCHGDRYRYDGKWYSEEEMLRIVRLKAFL